VTDLLAAIFVAFNYA